MIPNTSPYQSPDLVNYLKHEIRRYHDEDQAADGLCCLIGPQAYNITNKKALEKRKLHEMLDIELKKPLQNPYDTVTMPSTSISPHQYRNDTQIKFYKKRISRLEDDRDVDFESEAYRTKKILERQHYERKLEEELEKPIGPCELPAYSERAAPVASMGTPSVLYRNAQRVQNLKRQIKEYEDKMKDHEYNEKCLVCFLGPSAFAFSTNDLLEKQGLERKLEKEMAKPIDPTLPKDSKAYAAMQAPNEEYQNEQLIQRLQNQLKDIEEEYNETCCVFCFGVQGMNYSTNNEVKRNDLERKLEKELAKPKRNMQRY